MSYISNCIAVFLEKNNYTKEEDRAIYVYGIELIFSSLLILISILIISILFNRLYHAVGFLLLFPILRTHAGGYHASTYKRCYFASVSVYILFLSTSFLSADVTSRIFPVIAIVGNIIILLIAPTQNRVNKKTKEELEKNKKATRIILLVYDIIAFLFWKTGIFGNGYFLIASVILTIAILNIMNLLQKEVIL